MARRNLLIAAVALAGGMCAAGFALRDTALGQAVANAIGNNITACIGCAANSVVITGPGQNPIIQAPASASTVTGAGPAGFVFATSAIAAQSNLGGL